MLSSDPRLELRFVKSEQDLRAAQRLRYRVFVEELGARAESSDHAQRLEIDKFDTRIQHLCLFDTHLIESNPENAAVGLYRLISSDAADQIGGFYSEQEFELEKLLCLPGRKLELGRSCIHPNYRGGAAMAMLWQGLARYVREEKFDILFGTASFQGTNIEPYQHSLSLLFHKYLIKSDREVFVRKEGAANLQLTPMVEINQLQAMREIPSLIKAYLRLGGRIGQGAFVDHDFNTIDVFVAMETSQMVEKYKAIYA